MEEALIEVPTMRRFAGIELISDRIPDETTILTFRLNEKGMTMRQGTSVDATLIAAPSSTKNKEGKRDPDMHQTTKGDQWYHRFAEGCAYGMKVHAGVDKDSGLIQSVVDGDACHQSIAKRPEMAGKTTEFRVAMRPGKRRGLTGHTRWKAARSTCWRHCRICFMLDGNDSRQPDQGLDVSEHLGSSSKTSPERLIACEVAVDKCF